MSTKPSQHDIAVHLKRLANQEIEPENTITGLCHELYRKFDIPYQVSCALFIGWPHHSGDLCDPIKDTEERAYITRDYDSLGIWDPSYEGGKYRLLLCDWLANKLSSPNVKLDEMIQLYNKGENDFYLTYIYPFKKHPIRLAI